MSSYNCVVKIGYAKAGFSGLSNYIDKGSQGEDYNNSVDNFNLKETYNDATKKVFKFIISPEDIAVERGLDIVKFTRNVMDDISKELKRDINYGFGVHRNTDNVHAHVMFDANKIFLSKNFVKNKIPNIVNNVMDRMMGLKSGLDIVESIKKDIYKNRWVKMDEKVFTDINLDGFYAKRKNYLSDMGINDFSNYNLGKLILKTFGSIIDKRTAYYDKFIPADPKNFVVKNKAEGVLLKSSQSVPYSVVLEKENVVFVVDKKTTQSLGTLVKI
jgi:hypothetical protein